MELGLVVELIAFCGNVGDLVVSCSHKKMIHDAPAMSPDGPIEMWHMLQQFKTHVFFFND